MKTLMDLCMAQREEHGFIVGLRPLSPGGADYEALPQSRFFRELDCTFPMGGRLVRIRLENGAPQVEEM